MALSLEGAVDVHHHILPPEYLEALARLGVAQSIGVCFPAWSVQEDLAQMDRLGVATAVVSFSSPAANVPGTAAARSLAGLCNELAAELVEAHPGRYRAFATLPPLTDVEGVFRELERALDALGFVGVELMSNYGLRYLGDPAFEEVYAALHERRAVVHVHPTDPPGVQFGIPAAVMDAPFDTTRAAFGLLCSGVLERYPEVKFILSHGGGTLPYLSYRIGRMAPSVWEGFARSAPKGFEAYLGRFYCDTAIVSPSCLPLLVGQAGASHVVVGTDFPFSGKRVSAECLEGVRAWEAVGAEAREAILRGNALALFEGLGGVEHP